MSLLFRTKCTYYVDAQGAERVLRVIVAPWRRGRRWTGAWRSAQRQAVAVPALWRLSVAVVLAWIAVLTLHFS